MSKRKPKTNLGPPWIIFSDGGKPVAILPAGRPGEVANVEGLSMRTVQKIVSAANTRERGFYESFDKTCREITERLEKIGIKVSPSAGGPTGRNP